MIVLLHHLEHLDCLRERHADRLNSCEGRSPCKLVRRNCWKAESKEFECPNFDLDDADKLSFTPILKTHYFVPFTEQTFFE